MHVARRLLEGGREVVGVDNLNPYYDVRLKEARLRELAPFDRFRFAKVDLSDKDGIARLLETATGKKAQLDPQPMQPGDVYATAADTAALEAAVGFRPATPLDEGIQRYVA